LAKKVYLNEYHYANWRLIESKKGFKRICFTTKNAIPNHLDHGNDHLTKLHVMNISLQEELICYSIQATLKALTMV